MRGARIRVSVWTVDSQAYEWFPCTVRDWRVPEPHYSMQPVASARRASTDDHSHKGAKEEGRGTAEAESVEVGLVRVEHLVRPPPASSR